MQKVEERGHPDKEKVDVARHADEAVEWRRVQDRDRPRPHGHADRAARCQIASPPPLTKNGWKGSAQAPKRRRSHGKSRPASGRRRRRS